MQKPRLRKEGDCWRCWMRDAQGGVVNVAGDTPTAALSRCLYECMHRLSVNGSRREALLYSALLDIWAEVDGNIDATVREILLYTDNARGNELRDACLKIETIVNSVLEVIE